MPEYLTVTVWPYPPADNTDIVSDPKEEIIEEPVANEDTEDDTVEGTVSEETAGGSETEDDEIDAEAEANTEVDKNVISVTEEDTLRENSEIETITLDIPVDWVSEPEYDGDIEGIYVFTPVIEGYTVNTELPQITVTVGVPDLMQLMMPLAITSYDIWVNGIQVTDENKDDVLGDGEGTVRYIPAEGANAQKLILNGAVITEACTIYGYEAGIGSFDSLEIVLTDGTDNYVTGINGSGILSVGIYSTGSLSFSGGGNLTVAGGKGGSSYGIYAYPIDDGASAGISFTGSGSIIARGDDSASTSLGLFAKNFIQVLNGTFTVSGSTKALNIKPDYMSSSYTISASTDNDESGAQAISSGDLNTKYETYRYLRFAPGSPVASIGSTNYASIEAAVDAAQDGQTVKLLQNVELIRSITINEKDNRNITIDLNNKTIIVPSVYEAVMFKGNGALTIKNGTLEMKYEITVGLKSVILMDGPGTLNLQSCTVNNQAGKTNWNSQAIKMLSGTINAENCTIINRDASEVIYMSGDNSILNLVNCEVKSNRPYNSLGTDHALLLAIGGSVTIKGGIMDVNGTAAIQATANTSLYITGGANITSYNESQQDYNTYEKKPGTIYKTKGKGKVTIAGAEITNTSSAGYGLYAGDSYTATETPFVISKGSSVIKAPYQAMNIAPQLRPGIQGNARENYSTGSLSAYDENLINTYRYIEFSTVQDYAVTRIGEKNYTDLQAAVDEVSSDGTIQLINNFDLTDPVDTKGKSFTLDLNGRTMDGRLSTAINITGGTLSITDNAAGGGGTITGSSTASMIRLQNAGNLVINGGTLDFKGPTASAISHESSGDLVINGGTVKAATDIQEKRNTRVISNEGSGNININGGSVINTGYGMGIYNAASGTVNVRTGTVESIAQSAIYNYGDGTVNVSDGGTVQTKSGYYRGANAIYNNAGGAINVLDGGTVQVAVSTSKYYGYSAIFNNGTGKITISGNANVKNENDAADNATIVLNAGTAADTVLEIRGGTVANVNSWNGWAINNKAAGKVVITGGTTIIYGKDMAINTAPEIDASLAAYANTTTSSYGMTKYDPSKLDTYRYLEFRQSTVPGVPTDFKVTQGSRQLNLTWKAPANDGGREILRYEYTIDEGESWISTGSTATSYDITGLPDGTECKIQVRSVNENGAGAATSTLSKIFAGTPDKITGIEITPGDGKLTLKFATPYSGGSSISGYQYSTNNGSTWSNFITYSLGAEQTITINYLTNGTTYTVLVRATNAIGAGEASDPLTATPATIPGKPTINSVIAGNGQITVVFAPPGSDGGAEITEYRVKAAPSDGVPVTIFVPGIEVTETTKTVVVSGLTNGKNYTVTVEAVNIMGSTTSSNKYAMPIAVPGKPRNLQVTADNGKLRLKWDAPEDDGGRIEKYQYSLDGGDTWTDTIYYTSTNETIYSLANGTTYTVMVRALNAAGAGEASDPVMATPATIPGAPTLNNVTAGNAQLEVVFTPSDSDGGAEITEYRVKLAYYGGDTIVIAVPSSEVTEATKTVIIEGLTNGTTYTVTVEAVNRVGSTISNSKAGKPVTVPGKPINLMVKNNGSGSLILSWAAPDNGGSLITKYQYSLDNGETWTDLSPSPTATTKTIYSLTNGTTYIIKVRAFNANGVGEPSDPVAAKPVGKPYSPTNLKATAGDSSLILTWQAPPNDGGNDIEYYEYSLDNVEWFSTGSSETTYTLTGLTNGTSYTVRMRSYNSYYSSDYPPSVTATPVTVPAAPANLTANAANGKLILTWDAPDYNGGSAITGYQVSTDNGATWSPTGSTATTYTATGLTNGTTYTVRVRAVNAIGAGIQSEGIEAKPGYAPGPPLALQVTAGNEALQLKWDAPLDDGGNDIVYYEYSLNGGTWISTGSADTTYTISGLTNGITYSVKVRAFNSLYSGASTLEVPATPSPRPNPPTNVTAIAGDGKAIISFTLPVPNGGPAITEYIVTANPGGHTATGTTNEIEVNGLLNGTRYTFTVRSVNSIGESIESDPSNEVTPKAEQTISFETESSYNFGTIPVLSASASSSLAVTLTSETPDVCTISGDGTLTFLKAGTAIIKATQSGNDFYKAAEPISRSFTVNAVAPDSPFDVTATAGNGSATVSFSAPAFTGGEAISHYTVVSNPGNITVTGYTTEILVDGLTNGTEYTFTVTAGNIAGEGPASAESNSVTPKGNQSITFLNPGDQDYGTSLTLAATASSGMPVTFTSETPEVCTVTSDGTLTFLKAGTATITASQEGNNAYLPAPSVTHSFTVNPVRASAPEGLTVTTGDSQLLLTWTAPADNGGSPITDYEYSLNEGTWESTGSTDTSYLLTGLANGTSYTVKLRAVNAAGSGEESAGITETPLIITHTINATAGEGGSISPSGSITVNQGENITFTITANSGYAVSSVLVDGVSQGKITSYTFENITGDHSISAAFSRTGGGSSGSGGGSGSSGNSGSAETPAPAPASQDSPIQAEIKVTGLTDDQGNMNVSIDEQAVGAVLEQAMAEARKKVKEVIVVFNVENGSRNVTSINVNLPKPVQESIISNRIRTTVIVVDSPDIRISMDLGAIEEINRQARTDVNVTAARRNNNHLSDEARKAIGGRPVFDLRVNYGGSRQVQNFGTGSVTVTIPYTLGHNEKPENVRAVYVDNNGQVHWLENSVYDSKARVLRFSTEHFSTYAVGYREGRAFTDIAGHWAQENIEYVLGQGLFGGTSATTFSPDTKMTRGMFVTVLGRLAKADTGSFKASSFVDVKSDAYYLGAIEWASRQGIISGIGNNRFAPDEPVTREQMAAILLNYCRVMDIALPRRQEENVFADSIRISPYAKEAVKEMQRARLIGGKSGNLFDPKGTATRAEVAAVMHRFGEFVQSSN